MATDAAMGTVLAGVVIDRWGSDVGQVVGIIGGVLAIGVVVATQGRLAQMATAS